MFIARLVRSPRFVSLIISFFCILIFFFGFFIVSAPGSPPKEGFYRPDNTPEKGGQTHVEVNHAPVSVQEACKTDTASPSIGIEDVIHFLWNPSKASVTDRIFIDENGTVYKLPKNPLHTTNYGKQILILDLETRPLSSEIDWLADHFDYRKINHVSGGIFNHYTYAKIHGYDYKFIRASKFPDKRHDTWIKPSAISNLINDYKFVVFLDADATFHNLHLPLEWLLSYWNIQPHISVTMPKDPSDPKDPTYNADKFNRTLTNTGFMIWQNNPYTQEILKAWHECPDDKRYPGCSRWKKPRFHEQSAFGEYIRYDYERYIKELRCGEANGYPEWETEKCEGIFVRHYWYDKWRVKNDFMENVAQALTNPIQRLFAEKRKGVYTETKENKIL